MIYFYIALAVYLLSIVAVYYIARFMYFTANQHGPIPPWSWIIPLVNTGMVLLGFALCAKDIPILGTTYWTKRWDKEKQKQLNSLDSLEKEINNSI